MPIIGSLADFINLGKEYIVMVCAAGSETMNLITPTNAILMAGLAIAGVPYGRYLKAMWKFFVGAIIIVISVVTIASYLF